MIHDTPELPKPALKYGVGWKVRDYYTADQMRAYALQYAEMLNATSAKTGELPVRLVPDDSSTREYVDRLASDKQASVNFLKEAGILDARGSLAKPYRG